MYSKEHEKYLKKIKKDKIFVKIVQISIIVILLGMWELLARLNIINTFISSSPSSVIKTIISLHKQGNLYNNIWVTLYETLISFVLGSIIGLIISFFMWWNEKFAKIIDPYLTIINSLPKIALGPIFIIWIGANINSIITMALLISVIVTIVTIYNGFINTDPYKITLMKSFNASKWQIFWMLVFPSSKSTIISSIKLNISMSLIGIIMGEFLVSKEGIGYLIMYGSQVFNLNLVITGIFILGILSYILYLLITYIEKRVNKKAS